MFVSTDYSVTTSVHVQVIMEVYGSGTTKVGTTSSKPRQLCSLVCFAQSLCLLLTKISLINVHVCNFSQLTCRFECSCDHECNEPSIGLSDTSENQGRYDWCAKCVAGMVLQGLWIVRLEFMPYPMTWQALGWLLVRLTRPSSSGKRTRQRHQNRILSILGLQRTCAGSSATRDVWVHLGIPIS